MCTWLTIVACGTTDAWLQLSEEMLNTISLVFCDYINMILHTSKFPLICRICPNTSGQNEDFKKCSICLILGISGWLIILCFILFGGGVSLFQVTCFLPFILSLIWNSSYDVV